MKYRPWQPWMAIASLVTGLCVSTVAQAFTFDAQEVDQERFIAIAVPLAQSNRHNLLVLEQISETQMCWQKTDASAGIVDPLLLQFDFTGICGRSTDSNGYSIRIGDQDLGVNYSLSLVRRGDHLVLVGNPVRDRSAPTLEIGRTQSLEDGFLKIALDPEWRFAKRSYEGKTLGHIYLTRDTYPPASDPLPIATNDPRPETSSTAASTPDPEAEGLTANDEPGDPVPELTTAVEIPIPEPGADSSEVSNTEVASTEVEPSPEVSESSTPVAQAPANDSSPEPSGLSSPASPLLSGAFEIPVPEIPGTASVSESSSPASAPESPPASAPSNPISEAITIPVPEPVTAAPPAPDSQATAPAASSTPASSAPASTHNLPLLSPNLLPVPSAEIPLGNAINEPDVYNGNGMIALNTAPVTDTAAPGAPPVLTSPPPPVTPRYRVLANATNEQQQAEVKALVPDAFRSSYQGQTLLQVGAFQDRTKADEMVQLLSQRGIDTILTD